MSIAPKRGDTGMTTAEAAGRNTIFAVLTVGLIAMVLCLIPLGVMRWGFMPQDDAMRHVAKAISGRDWSQILFLHEDIKLDTSYGWHALLSLLHNRLDLERYPLVVFSVSSLFVLFSIVPVLLMKRPEGWVMALLAMNIWAPNVLLRLFLGRPYIISMAVVVAIGCLWERLSEKKNCVGIVSLLAAMIALESWAHSGWYVFFLPVLALFMARQRRAGLLVLAAVISGSVVGAVLSGHPIMFFVQSVKAVLLAFGHFQVPKHLISSELHPFAGEANVVTVVVMVLLWRAARGDWDRRAIDNPVALLALTCWALGFITVRVWLDIGLAATILWLAQEFQVFLVKDAKEASLKRSLMIAISSALLFLSMTNDAGNRWSQRAPTLNLAFDTPERASWAPGPGGIVYNNHMLIFFNMFYQNPTAPWRYVVGFEQGIVAPEELKIVRNVQSRFEAASFAPWVKRMRLEDRLITITASGARPNIEELEWFDAGNRVWIGRLQAGSLYKDLDLSGWYNATGQYERTISLLEGAIEHDQTHADAYYLNLAIAYAEVGKAAQAIGLLERLIASGRRGAEACYNLALIYKNMGQRDKAMSLFRESIKADSCFAAAYYGLGIMHHDLGDLSSAVSNYRKAMRLAPGNAALYNDLAVACFSLNRHGEAMKYLKKAIAADPRFAGAYLNLGIFSCILGKNRESITYLEKAIDLDPKWGRAHADLAIAYYYEKRYDVAIQYSDKAAALGYEVRPEFLARLKPYRK